MNRRLRVLVAVAGRLPHPDPPTESYLRRMRSEPGNRAPGRLIMGDAPKSVLRKDSAVPVRHGLLRVRTYQLRTRPTGLRPLVINFHGGGFVFGNLAQTDWLCGRIAEALDAVVVSVSYRLAPEHPAPLPYEDCADATCWLVDHADALGADPRQVSVMGSSAGGNLAALVAIAHRDRVRADPSVAPLAHQVLMYPATDLGLTSPSVTELIGAPILSRAIMDWYGRQYLPQDLPGSLRSDDPTISPLFHTDLSGVAPALVIGAGRDPLRDDAVRYAEALRDAGVRAELIVYPDAVHGFVSMPRIASEAEPALQATIQALDPRP